MVGAASSFPSGMRIAIGLFLLRRAFHSMELNFVQESFFIFSFWFLGWGQCSLVTSYIQT